MARQFARRVSRGCEEAIWTGVEVLDWAVGAGAARLRFVRRVSWTPGAEGAPVKRPWVVVEAWPFWGTMRRDCGRGSTLVLRVSRLGRMDEVYHSEGVVCCDAAVEWSVIDLI